MLMDAAMAFCSQEDLVLGEPEISVEFTNGLSSRKLSFVRPAVGQTRALISLQWACVGERFLPKVNIGWAMGVG